MMPRGPQASRWLVPATPESVRRWFGSWRSRRRRHGPQSFFDQRGEGQVQTVVGRKHVATAHHVLAPGEIGDKAAGFAHQQQAGGNIPGAEAEFPKPVKATGRDIGEIERGGAE